MIIENKSFDGEREFYGCDGVTLKNCSFDGERDGESAFKESRNITLCNCYFNLRYPFWHDSTAVIKYCELTEFCRAAIWYSENIEIGNTKLHGIKALRECKNASIIDCDIVSPEFGWSCEKVSIKNCKAQSEYFMLRSSELDFSDFELNGKYSFQYIENSVFDNCVFNTKDAFWHAKNVTVKNSIINGEYLAWYCENVTFINCKISGTQPLCYCKGLKLVDCTMENTDLAFEKSDVDATVNSDILSIKNPRSGKIVCKSVGEVIKDEGSCQLSVVSC